MEQAEADSAPAGEQTPPEPSEAAAVFSSLKGMITKFELPPAPDNTQKPQRRKAEAPFYAERG